jgi:hypothetical protein
MQEGKAENEQLSNDSKFHLQISLRENGDQCNQKHIGTWELHTRVQTDYNLSS